MIIGFPAENVTFTGRSTMGGTAADSGYTNTDVMTYDTAKVTKWTIASTTIYLTFDRGASFATSNPTMVQITGFSVSDYNHRTHTSAGLTSIVVQQDNNSGFTSPTTLATITNGTPTYGDGAFGLPTLFSEFSQAADERYMRVGITTSASITVTIGNIYISSGINSDTGSWGLGNQWEIAAINRDRITETEGGGMSVVTRQGIRRASGTIKTNAAYFDVFMDAALGRNTALVDSTGYPWAVCFDEDNASRAVTGKHLMSGLWRLEGQISARNTGGIVGGINFQPDMAVTFREWL